MNSVLSEESSHPLEERSRHPLQEVIWVVLLSLSLSIALCFVSNNLSGRFELRGKNIQNHFAILAGQPGDYGFPQPLYLPAFQNRILFPALLRGASSIKLFSVPQWYLLLRLLTAVAMFATFYATLRRYGGCDPRLASLGTGWLAYVLLFTFNHPYEHTSDFPDAFFITLMLACVLSNRLLPLLLVCVFAATNRESAAFGGVLWAVVHGLPNDWSKLRGIKSAYGGVRWNAVLGGGFVSVVTYATVIGLRYAFGGAKAIARSGQTLTGWTELKQSLISVIHSPTPSSWPLLAFAMIVPLTGWIMTNRPYCVGEDRRVVTAGLLIGFVTVLFGLVHELRVFIPSLVLLCYAAAAMEAKRGSLMSVAAETRATGHSSPVILPSSAGP